MFKRNDSIFIVLGKRTMWTSSQRTQLTSIKLNISHPDTMRYRSGTFYNLMCVILLLPIQQQQLQYTECF
ncbi:hypothetical protein J6590_061782 [Homalodisca vitripennis]|nr:hypothetical protein J6590_061782 [Homalodisca vitripennis]